MPVHWLPLTTQWRRSGVFIVNFETHLEQVDVGWDDSGNIIALHEKFPITKFFLVQYVQMKSYVTSWLGLFIFDHFQVNQEIQQQAQPNL